MPTVKGDISGWGQTLASGPEWLLYWPRIESLSPTTLVTLYAPYVSDEELRVPCVSASGRPPGYMQLF